MARPFVGGRLLGIVYHRSFDRTTWILLRLQDEMDARQFLAQRLEPALFIVDKPVNSTNFAAQRDSPNRLTRAVASSLWNDEDTPSSTLRRWLLSLPLPLLHISHIYMYISSLSWFAFSKLSLPNIFAKRRQTTMDSVKLAVSRTVVTKFLWRIVCEFVKLGRSSSKKSFYFDSKLHRHKKTNFPPTLLFSFKWIEFDSSLIWISGCRSARMGQFLELEWFENIARNSSVYKTINSSW